MLLPHQDFKIYYLVLLHTSQPLIVCSAAAAAATYTQCFLRAVMANWLVCVAVWNAGAASSLPGKVLGIWPPISAFVAIGLEHSVANM